MSEAEEDFRILCVDDEPRVLQGIERTLGLSHDVTTAEGGEAALQILEREGPFALTISDMRMPGMDGATYLSRVAQMAPDTVRVLLTGQADVEASIRAINEGRIFRFLTKPCEASVLQRTVEDGLAHFRLVTAEKQLLQKTLYGCIKVLTELLSLGNPIAYEHGREVIRLVNHVASQLGIEDSWQMELAVMLGHLGYVGVSPDLLRKAYAGEALSAAERKRVRGAFRTAHSLLEGIPRIEAVLEVVSRLAGSPPPLAGLDPAHPDGRESWAVHLILAAERAHQLSHDARSSEEVAARLRQEGVFDGRIVSALQSASYRASLEHEMVRMPARGLRPGMILMADASSADGVLLAKRGQEVTDTLVKLLQRMAERGNLKEPLAVGVKS